MKEETTNEKSYEVRIIAGTLIPLSNFQTRESKCEECGFDDHRDEAAWCERCGEKIATKGHISLLNLENRQCAELFAMQVSNNLIVVGYDLDSKVLWEFMGITTSWPASLNALTIDEHIEGVRKRLQGIGHVRLAGAKFGLFTIMKTKEGRL